jgi:hypothetical protein
MGNESSPWGMVIHYPDNRLIDILGQGGVQWLRTETNFQYQERPGQRPHEYPAWGATNIVLDSAKRNGQSVYFGLQPHYPGWILRGRPRLEEGEEDPGRDPIFPPRPRPRPRPGQKEPTPEEQEAWRRRFEHWGNFVRLVIDEVAPRGVTHFNIANEPNDPNFYPYGSEDYVTALVVAAQVIHSAGCKVIAPDIATGSEHHPWEFLDFCLRRLRANGQYLDAVSIHGYPRGGDNLTGLLNSLYDVVHVLRNNNVTAPVWLTETGVDNRRSDARRENGDRVKEICSWIGEGTVKIRTHPKRPSQSVPKFLKKVFFYVWSDDQKYGWLSPRPALEPLSYVWDAYRSVTGGR